MNIGIFAAESTGLAIVELFRERRHPISCLVLDRADREGFSDRIRAASCCDTVFYDSTLYEPKTLAALEALNLDLVILAWWPHIIRKPLFPTSRLGFLNMHPSLLPHNRGKHYYFWSIVEGAPFGVTLHTIDEDIDSGHIAFQRPLDIRWEDTGRSLRDRAVVAMVELFRENFDQIVAGRLPSAPVDTSRGSFHWGRELEEASRIDLDKQYTGRELLNILRARSGFQHGGAWFMDQGVRHEISIAISRQEND